MKQTILPYEFRWEGKEKTKSSLSKNVIKSAISICDKLERPRLLSEIGKERIRLVGNELKKTNNNIDIGFKVLKVKGN